MGQRSKSYIIFAAAICCFVCFKEVQSQTPSHNDCKWELSLGGGYFSPAREGFREYYGSNAQFEIDAAYKISSLLRAGADFSYTRLRKSEYPVKFTMISFAPTIKLVFRMAQTMAPYLGGGVGYYKGTVKVCAESAQGKFSQNGVGLKGYGGFRYPLTERMFLAVEGRYCHTFLGDPDKGDFGNVGGFSGMAKLGMFF